jgi:hypothetical protein
MITRRLAPIARFAADAVVLMMSCVPLTLLAARAARFNACGKLPAKEIEVPVSLSRHDLSRCLTHDGAIEAEPNALDEFRNLGLSKRQTDLVFALELPIRVETFALVRGGAWCASFASIAGSVLNGPFKQRLGSRAHRTVAPADAGASALKCRVGIGAARGPKSVNAFGSLTSASERMPSRFRALRLLAGDRPSLSRGGGHRYSETGM